MVWMNGAVDSGWVDCLEGAVRVREENGSVLRKKLIEIHGMLLSLLDLNE